MRLHHTRRSGGTRCSTGCREDIPYCTTQSHLGSAALKQQLALEAKVKRGLRRIVKGVLFFKNLWLIFPVVFLVAIRFFGSQPLEEGQIDAPKGHSENSNVDDQGRIVNCVNSVHNVANLSLTCYFSKILRTTCRSCSLSTGLRMSSITPEM